MVKIKSHTRKDKWNHLEILSSSLWTACHCGRIIAQLGLVQSKRAVSYQNMRAVNCFNVFKAMVCTVLPGSMGTLVY